MIEEDARRATAVIRGGSSNRWSDDRVIFGVLLALSLGGIAIADFSMRFGLYYWLLLAPVFAAASLYTGFTRARSHGEPIHGILWRQALHWTALALAIYLVFLLQRTGRLNQEDAGLVSLIALALCTLLAGVHFDWRLLVLGGLLGIAAACSALVEEFFWILLLPAILAGAVAIFWRGRTGEPGDSTQP